MGTESTPLTPEQEQEQEQDKREPKGVMTVEQAQALVAAIQAEYANEGTYVDIGVLWTKEGGCCAVGAAAIHLGISGAYYDRAIDLYENDDLDMSQEYTDLTNHIAILVLQALGIPAFTVVTYYLGTFAYHRRLHEALWKYFDRAHSLDDFYQWLLDLPNAPAKQ